MKRLYGIFVILLFGIDFIFGQSVKSDSLFHVGMEQYNEHKYELAIKTFNYVKELDILENGNEFYRNFYADWWISSSYLQMGDSAKAESISDYYDTCPIDRILVRQSDSLACLAQKYFEENNAEKALLYINESILIEKRFYHNTSFFLNSISNAIYYYVKSENNLIDDILPLVEDGCLIINTIPDSKQSVIIKYNFYYLAALYYNKKGDFGKCKKILESFKNDINCYRTYSKTQYYEKLIITCFHPVKDAYLQEDYNYVEEVLDLQSYLYGSDSPNLLRFLIEKISWLFGTGNKSEAIATSLRSLEIIKQLDFSQESNYDFLKYLYVIAHVLYNEDILDKAEYAVKMYLYYIKQNKLKGGYQMAILYGKILKQQNRYYDALRYMQKALSVISRKSHDNKEYIDLLLNIADCYHNLGQQKELFDVNKELDNIAEQLDLQDPESYYRIKQFLISTLYKYSNKQNEAYKKAKKIYDKLLHEDREFSLRARYTELFAMSVGLGDFYKTGNYSSLYNSSRVLNTLFGFMNQVYSIDQQENLLHDKFSLNNMLDDVICNMNNVPEANMMLFDGRLLLSGYLLDSERQFKQFIKNSGNIQLIELYHDYLEDCKNIYKIENISSRVKDSIENIAVIKLRKLSEECNKLGYKNEDVNIHWEDVQKCLGPKDLAVDFITYNSKTPENIYIALLLSKNYKFPIFHYICSQKDLNSYMTNGVADYAKLSEVIWSSLQDKIKNYDNIYFVPSGDLYKLPIESFLESKRVYRLSSLRELTRNQGAKPIKNAVIYGGLNYSADASVLIDNAKKYSNDRDIKEDIFRECRCVRESSISLPYLVGTKKEAESIYNLFSYKNDEIIDTKLFLYNEGTETSFKSLSGKNIDIIHIGTHGYYNDDKYLGSNTNTDNWSMIASGLLFAGAEKTINGIDLPKDVDDGLLTPLEISCMDLSEMDLITLSACNTALGKITSDGVSGLQLGFKKAGVKSMIMSLWNVDDEATQILMTEFYSNWLEKKMTKHDALENAKECVRTNKTHPQWSDPKYWAAFILLDGLN